jgi:hypothetical protein
MTTTWSGPRRIIPIRIQNPVLEGVWVSLLLGFKVFPVVPGGKRPAISRWPKRATKDPSVASRYFADHPKFNYGILTGAPSGFFALDPDGPEGRATIAALVKAYGPLPETIEVLTPHGEHYYFAMPGYPIPNSVGRVGPGVDVRGDGGYVVGRGSRTPDGTYRFAEGHAPEDVAIAAAPAWLLNRIGRKS